MLKQLLNMIIETKKQRDLAHENDEYKDYESKEEFFYNGKLEGLNEILRVIEKERGL